MFKILPLALVSSFYAFIDCTDFRTTNFHKSNEFALFLKLYFILFILFILFMIYFCC